MLDYKGVPYQTVEVHPLFKSEISWCKDYKKVPILVLPDGEHVVESSQIMDTIYALPGPGKAPARSGWCACPLSVLRPSLLRVR